jgi:hypothetical protein
VPEVIVRSGCYAVSVRAPSRWVCVARCVCGARARARVRACACACAACKLRALGAAPRDWERKGGGAPRRTLKSSPSTARSFWSARRRTGRLRYHSNWASSRSRSCATRTRLRTSSGAGGRGARYARNVRRSTMGVVVTSQYMASRTRGAWQKGVGSRKRGTGSVGDGGGWRGGADNGTGDTKGVRV